jgi:hypothetical protein
VYAQDLAFVHGGQKVSATVEGAPARQNEGEIVFVAPQIDPQTRTATVRVALPNMELALRPGMFATAHIHAQLAPSALLVPREAVIDTGRRQVAFVASGDGHFEPRQVKLGPESTAGKVQVLDGLSEGVTVVVCGQFLLDAEIRMQEAIQKHLRDRAGQPATVVPTPVVAAADHATPPATRPASQAGASADVDDVFRAYLKIQDALGAKQQSDAAADASPLAGAARARAGQANGHVKHLLASLADHADAMRDKPLPEQRKLYKPLSDAAIALADAAPPSPAVAAQLFVAFCPMAPGEGARWLQTTPTIANPYFATSMKECGTIERAIGGTSRAATSPTTAPSTSSSRKDGGR